MAAKFVTHEEQDDLISYLDTKFEHIDQKFERIDQRFTAIDQRFTAIEHRFTAIEHRFDEKFTAIEHRFGEKFDALVSIVASLAQTVQQNSIDIRQNSIDINRLEKKLDQHNEALTVMTARHDRTIRALVKSVNPSTFTKALAAVDAELDEE